MIAYAQEIKKHNKKINGTVVSTKPLSIRGQIVPEFKLVFKDGYLPVHL